MDDYDVMLSLENIRNNSKMDLESFQQRKRELEKSKIVPGDRFGNLTVLHLSSLEVEGHTWICKCDCGTTTVAREESLLSGARMSCNCIKIKQKREREALIDSQSA